MIRQPTAVCDLSVELGPLALALASSSFGTSYYVGSG